MPEPGPRTASPAEAALRGLLFVLAFIALQRFSLQFGGAGRVSLWYLPAGLILAFLARFGPGNAPWVFAATALAGALQSPLPVNHAAAAVGTLAYTLGAVVLRRAPGWFTGIPRVRDGVTLTLAALLASGLAAYATMLYLHATGTAPGAQWPVVALHWWVGDLVGILTLTPSLLLSRHWFARLPGETAGRGARGRLERAKVLAVPLTAALVFVVALPLGLHVEFLCFLPLLWVAMRDGLVAAVRGTFLMNVSVALLTWQSPLGTNELLEIQLLIATLSATAILLGAGVTERQKDRDRLAELALTDALTGLPNRHGFLQDVQGRLAGPPARSGTGGGLTLAALDISRLKWINDAFGQATGDQYLQAFGQRLTRLPAGWSVARLGGGTFALAADAGRADPAVLHDALKAPVQLDGRELTVAYRLGSVSAEGGVSASRLLLRAEEALDEARRSGRDVIVAPGPHRGAYAALEYEQDLRRALESGQELHLHYQPQTDLTSGQVVAFEALIRWQHPVRGLLSPAEFLPVAERTGLIVPIGAWVLEEACRQRQAWAAAFGRPDLRMAVNISPSHLHTGTLLPDVTRALEACGMPGDCLELELTEGTLLLDPERAARVLSEVQARGVRVALDDFGTGYSSIRHLKDFRVSTLKIDRAFIRHLATDEGDRRIVTGLVVLGHLLGMTVLAEGAEDLATVHLLRGLGCDGVQGYALGRPRPAAEAGEALGNAPLVPFPPPRTAGGP